MPRKDYEEGEQPASEQKTGASGQQPGTTTPTPATEQLLNTLNDVFVAFRQQSLDQGTTVFDEDAKRAVGEFNDILAKLRFRRAR